VSAERATEATINTPLLGEERRRPADAGAGLIRAIRAVGHEQGFARGERISPPGTPHAEEPILMIESGFVTTAATAPPNRQRTLLSIHGPGDLVGEHVLFGDPAGARRLAVTGLTDGRAWGVGRDRFRQILDDTPRGWEMLARYLDDRAAAAEDRICLMAGETAGRRLAVFLLQLLSRDEPAWPAIGHSRRVPVPLSRTDLAEWIGVSRETVERVIAGWVRRGMVRTGRRDLVVHDLPGLEKIAGDLQRAG